MDKSEAELDEQLRQVMVSLWGAQRLSGESMQKTPQRVLSYWRSMAQATPGQDACDVLLTTFPCESSQIVVEQNIEFASLCEHHLLPFTGVAHVGYIPNGRVVGLSKIPRCLDILAARPQIQERLTNQLALAIELVLEPVGVAVILKASHSCMSARGVSKPAATTVTSCMKGAFDADSTARAEFMQLIQL